MRIQRELQSWPFKLLRKISKLRCFELEVASLSNGSVVVNTVFKVVGTWNAGPSARPTSYAESCKSC